MSADRFASSARWFVVQTEDVGDWASGVLPVGTVTFLLTDVEGSTRLWEANQDETAAAIARHYEILDAAVGAAGGVRPVEQGEGDSIVAAFATAKDALRAALDAQRELGELDGLPVRMAIHTGEAQLRDEGNYVGRTIIRCAHAAGDKPTRAYLNEELRKRWPEYRGRSDYALDERARKARNLEAARAWRPPTEEERRQDRAERPSAEPQWDEPPVAVIRPRIEPRPVDTTSSDTPSPATSPTTLPPQVPPRPHST